MLDAIEKVLILQDRDRRLGGLQAELTGIAPQRQLLQARLAGAQGHFESVRQQLKQIESDRKELELEVEAYKQRIEKYALQQFQTKKNDEYRALAHEIDTCRAEIVKLDDRQLELMEKAEVTQKQATAASKLAAETKALIEQQLASLGTREQNLHEQIREAAEERERCAASVEESVLARYERLRRSKGGSVAVGIEHSVCGGCHMQLPPQIVLTCKAEQELVACPNCARLLYYTRDMNLVVAE